MEYCRHLWGGSAKYKLEALDSVDHHARRIIGDKSITQAKLHSLQHRRNVTCLSVFYRIYFRCKGLITKSDQGVGIATVPANAALVDPNQVNRRHQSSRGEPLETSGPESCSLERLCLTFFQLCESNSQPWTQSSRRSRVAAHCAHRRQVGAPGKSSNVLLTHIHSYIKNN
ncbi:jg8273 [Pararge aegeria aegeria]|uniref:Jg8273 protein n=1 Tax=Pararge aegeria aegeria TaxID=348720 RepID=A0A8S4RDA3_9NEOP|nr:jg8273 [Pararge aegeria aegeria]